MNEAPRINMIELSVSEVSAALKRAIEDGFDHVRVRGELGKVSYHGNGHIYFDLKDDRACISGVVWKSVSPRIAMKLETGLEVIATGRITTYAARSQYQMVVEAIEPAGAGALMALLEERKKKLAAEGLFDPARKQLLPYMPEVIGVITSPTGAVIRDILHRLSDRFPRHVIVWPVRVQGESAAGEVAAAIAGFNALSQTGPLRRPDLLIVARGGGSLEDLWPFNEEIVVRAAAASHIPLISAVGHETDVTLIDFASDMRAPTPTAAAEMAVPVRADLLASIGALGLRHATCWRRGLDQRRKDMRALARALPAADRLLESRRQRLDGLAERLPQALRTNAHVHHRAFSQVAMRLAPGILRARTGLSRERLATLIARGAQSMRVMLERRDDRLDALTQLLAAFSYRNVLERGFALIRDGAGAPLRAAAAVSAGMPLSIEFADGRVNARAEGAPTMVARPAPRKRRGSGGGEGQGSLFG